MADVNAKMSVSGISQFKQGMKDAEASVKTLDAAMKANEKSFKQTGDAENHLAAQTNLLNQKLQQQKIIVKNAEQALKQMEANGVKTTSAAYQNMQRRMIEAQSSMLDTEMEIQNLGSAAADASGKTDQLSTSLGGLNKKLSLDQVISGISAITGAMEKAGQKAVDLGKKIWENITDSARWADDAATQAMILNMDVEDYQRYKKVFDTVGDITVAEWQKAKLKVQKAINTPTGEQTDILSILGLNTKEWKTVSGQSGPALVAKNFEDMFWEIGKTLRDKVERGELTQDMADVYANALFGKGFAELNPLFNLGEEEFTKALEKQNVVEEENVNKLASLNDQLITLQGNFDTLKDDMLAELAPALEGAAKALDGMLTSLLEYLKTPEGKQALEDMGKAIEGLFSDITEIDPQQVVKGFSDVFNSIVGGLQWLSTNSGSVIGAMEAIVAGWGLMRLGGGALEIVKLINGIKGLSGTAAAASAAGTTAGAAWGGAFATAALAAAPWLLALLAAKAIPEENKLGSEKRVEAAAYTEEELLRLREWVQIQNELTNLEGKFGTEEFDEAAYDSLLARLEKLGNVQQGDLWSRYWDYLVANNINPNFDQMPTDFLDNMLENIPVEVQPEAAEGSAEDLAEQIGTVYVDVVGDIVEINDRHNRRNRRHANGLPYVPFDGYAAILDKGERVVPARENGGSRSFSSNLYIENMNMNNGVDADGLAARIAAANRRTMSGFGS